MIYYNFTLRLSNIISKIFFLVQVSQALNIIGICTAPRLHSEAEKRFVFVWLCL